MTVIRMTVASLAFVTSIAATPAAAQEPAPRAELFAGYSFLPADGNDFPRQASHGLQAGIGVSLTRWFSVAAEVGQQWDTTTHTDPNFAGLVSKTTVREYLVGPRFTARGRAASVFAHGWFGGATGDAGDTFSGFSDSGLTFGGGGGVDVAITPQVAMRGQFDWLGSFADIVEDNARVALGLVWRIGRR